MESDTKNSQNQFPLERFVKEKSEKLAEVILILSVAFFFFTVIFVRPPADFPVGHIITIDEGLSLDEIIGLLEKENIIRSPFWFKSLTYLSSNQNKLVAGDYIFNRKLGLFSIISRLARGEYGIVSEKVVLPEGATVEEMGLILKGKFPDFDLETFTQIAEDKEGFLFPDTYKFLPNVGPRQAIFTLEQNFESKIAPLLLEIKESGHSLEEIVIMASLLEEEAREQESREMISGVLWKRIEIGMPLQVDAVFPYIIGKNTYQLSLEDLKFDSPYNTYQNVGLPPGAISNPGLSSITAALRPQENPYLFYLSDRNGKLYYAENFEKHKRNKALYLR